MREPDPEALFVAPFETDYGLSDPPFRVTVQSIDVSEIEEAIRIRADKFGQGVCPETKHAAAQIEVLRHAFAEIQARLDIATQRCAARTQMPRAFRRFRFLAPYILGPYNYLTKSQREAAVEQIMSISSLIAILRLKFGAYDD